jgi:hypothetical protein
MARPRTINPLQCQTCRRVLPPEAFNRNKASWTGMDRLCRTCRRGYMASVRPPKRVPPTIPLPDSAWAYVAGILDGEGCMRMEWYGGGKHSPHI